MNRLIAMVMLPTLLIGCGPSADEQAAQDYVAAMTPLLVNNSELSRGFLDLGVQIKRGERTGPLEVAEQLEDKLIPAARSLSEGVAAVEPSSKTLSGVHIDIVRAWSNREKAYVAMHEAWLTGDLAAFEGIAESHRTVFKAEERYFKNVGKVLSEYQLTLKQYP